jgi:hypothetical protein
MPRAIRSEYKGVWFSVSESDEPGYYRFEFVLEGQMFSRKTRTKLPGMAARRARTQIDRKLREKSASQSTSHQVPLLEHRDSTESN